MSAEKRKGDAFEREVIRVLRANGFPYAERVLRLGAHDDRGDIIGVPGFHIDCKARRRFELSTWVDEVVTEAPEDAVPIIVLKRPGASPDRAYVIVELATFARVVS